MSVWAGQLGIQNASEEHGWKELQALSTLSSMSSLAWAVGQGSYLCMSALQMFKTRALLFWLLATLSQC